MVTLHGRHLRAGFTVSTNKAGRVYPSGGAFLPFPPFTSISINLPSGLSQIFQIGIVPLVGLIEYHIPPTEFTIQATLAYDYPYYQQLFSFLQKSPYTFHFPPADIRIGAVTIPGFGITPIINLWCCLARRAQLTFSERFSTLSMTFTVPYGVYIPSSYPNDLPSPFIPQSEPVRRFEVTCRIYTDIEGEGGALGASAMTVTSAEIEYNANITLSTTMPNLLHAFFGRAAPYEPMPISGAFTAREGSVSYSGNIRFVLPPTGTAEFPQHITGARRFIIELRTPIGIFRLVKAKVLSFAPSLNATAPLEWTLQFNALGLFFAQ